MPANAHHFIVVGISGVTCGGKTTLAHRLRDAHPGSVLVEQDNYFLPEDDPRHVPAPGVPSHSNWDCLAALDMERMVHDVTAILDGNKVEVSSEYVAEISGEKAKEMSDKNEIQPSGGNAARGLTGSVIQVAGEDQSAGENVLVVSGHEGSQRSSLAEESALSDVPSRPQTLTSSADDPSGAWRLLIVEGFLALADARLRSLCDILWCVTLPYDECRARRILRVYDPPDPEGYFDACVWPEYEAALARLRRVDVEGRVRYVSGEMPQGQMFERLACEVTELMRRSRN